RPQKRLPSKLFYDERGSRLFEQITQVDEYYLTRTEKKILQTNSSDIAEIIGPWAALIELGSGSSRKTRLLLDHLTSLAAYMPVDISEQYMQKMVDELRADYPRIPIIPTVADYTNSLKLPALDQNYNRQVVFFPGSTIGNFNPPTSRSFIETIAMTTDQDACMLLGVDLKKDKKILEAAYNDSRGITARFNKNMLTHINRALSADFKVDQFRHRAFFNEAESRIEMHLVSTKKQEVDIAGRSVSFRQGESIHTENSYKYTLPELKKLVAGWFEVEQIWTDAKKLFSVQYLSKK